MAAVDALGGVQFPLRVFHGTHPNSAAKIAREGNLTGFTTPAIDYASDYGKSIVEGQFNPSNPFIAEEFDGDPGPEHDAYVMLNSGQIVHTVALKPGVIQNPRVMSVDEHRAERIRQSYKIDENKPGHMGLGMFDARWDV